MADPRRYKLSEGDYYFIDKELDFLTEVPGIRRYSRAVSENLLNVFEFNEKYLGYKLFPREIFALKIIYGIPLDEDDEKEIQWLLDNKNIRIEWNEKGYHEIVFVMGRKSGKTAFTAIICSYETYRIHQIFNPQDYFGLLPDAPISIVACSASGTQAEEMHLHIKAAIQNCSYFDDYVDKLNEKEISIFTQRDVEEEKKKGEGSIAIRTMHSLSRTIRTYNAFVVVMDELAHMINNSGVYSGEALYNALTPSVTLFKKWGRIISLSSPLGKAGKLYDLYKNSQQEDIHSIACFQYATWEFNPNTAEEDFEDEFKKDPESAEMEYKGNFGAVIDALLPPEKIDAVFDEPFQKFSSKVGNRNYTYAVTVDPSKNGDRYAIAVGHKETIQIKGVPVTFKFIDLLHYFEAEVIKTDEGYKKKDIDIEQVEEYIWGLVRRGFKIGLVAYDQFQSTASIQRFNKRQLNAKETTFTSKYKEKIYGDLKTDLMNGTVKGYSTDLHIEGKLAPIEIAKIELKHIQRTIKGKTVHIGHPKTGPVQTDDMADAIANLCHVLTLDEIHTPIRQKADKPIVARTSGTIG